MFNKEWGNCIDACKNPKGSMQNANCPPDADPPLAEKLKNTKWRV